MTYDTEAIAIDFMARLCNLGRGERGKILCSLRGLRHTAGNYSIEAADLRAIEIGPNDGPACAATLRKRLGGARPVSIQVVLAGPERRRDAPAECLV